jgi:hypothetical protein
MIPFSLLDLQTSSKQIKEHMQRKKSQHNEILKEFLANIITFNKKLDEHFENSTRHKTRAITVLNIRETMITQKLSMDMTSPTWKLLLEALFLTKLSLKTWKGYLAT